MRHRLIVESVVISSMLVGGLAAAAEVEIDFNRDIRPILAENCFKCHGFDPGARKAGLRLDDREGATKPAESGEAAIVPGSAETSELIRRITSGDEAIVMPPPDTGRKLKAEQIALLTRWIAEGADDPLKAAWLPNETIARSWMQYRVVAVNTVGLKLKPSADAVAGDAR